MSNPYQSPTSQESAFQTSPGDLRRRPMGVTLVAILFLLAGLGGVAVVLMGAAEFGNEPNEVIWDLAYMLPNAVAGVALVRGKTWGWILANLLVFTRLFQHASMIVAMLGTAMPMMMAPFSANFTGLAIWGSLLTYLFKAHVLEFFGVPQEKRLAMLGGLGVVSLLLLIGASTLRRFALN